METLLETLRENLAESSDFSETFNDYVIEVDNLIIPNISNENDKIEISMDVNYNIDNSHEERGQFNSPENSKQGEGKSIEIVNAIPITVTVNGSEQLIKSLLPEQIDVIKDYVENYLIENESNIKEKILNTNGLDEMVYLDKDNINTDPFIFKLRKAINQKFKNMDGQNFQNSNVFEDGKNIVIQLYLKLLKQSFVTKNDSLSYILKLSQILKAETIIYSENNLICIELKTNKSLIQQSKK